MPVPQSDPSLVGYSPWQNYRSDGGLPTFQGANDPNSTRTVFTQNSQQTNSHLDSLWKQYGLIQSDNSYHLQQKSPSEGMWEYVNNDETT